MAKRTYKEEADASSNLLRNVLSMRQLQEYIKKRKSDEALAKEEMDLDKRRQTASEFATLGAPADTLEEGYRARLRRASGQMAGPMAPEFYEKEDVAIDEEKAFRDRFAQKVDGKGPRVPQSIEELSIKELTDMKSKLESGNILDRSPEQQAVLDKVNLRIEKLTGGKPKTPKVETPVVSAPTVENPDEDEDLSGGGFWSRLMGRNKKKKQ